MASSETGSKLSIIRIVQVLLRESDKDHPLSQQDILRLMESKYGMVVSRKSAPPEGGGAACDVPRGAAHGEWEGSAAFA